MPDNISDTQQTSEPNTETMASGTAQQKFTERYNAARERIREQWAVAKGDLGQLKQKAVDYSQSAAKATNTFAHDHPWKTAGAAIGVGALIGWLVTRHSGDTDQSSR
ncbi:MAG: protein of unknown function ElaB [Rhodocyclaceae bacterium]|nr:protein of unknown function ElaB [Rhodocyclaceae bacterium]